MAATATHTDDHAHPVTLPDATVDVGRIRRMSLIALVVGAAAFLICGFVGLGQDKEHGVRDFFLAYLCGFVFWVCVPFGSLGLSMIGFLASASWGIVFRRIFQASIRTLPVAFALGIPVIVSLYLLDGKQSPYWWSDSVWYGLTQADKDKLTGEDKEHYEEAVEKFVGNGWKGPDADLHMDKEKVAEIAAYQHSKPEAVAESLHKIHDWLSPNAFAIRYVVYFAILGVIAFAVMRNARSLEDNDDHTALSKLRNLSGPLVPVFVLTLTVFVTDWVMSVEPTWASSMFPVIFGMNMFLTTFMFSAFVLYTLVRIKGDTGGSVNRPDLSGVVKDKFRIDIGSLTLGFCMVWAYGSFCQFMLIWAGNLPEEITYYLKRGGGEYFGDKATSTHPTSWIYLSYFLMAFHWLVPFIVLLMREVKTSPQAMKIVAVGLLTVCAADVIWWILPAVPHEHTTLHLPMAFGAILGVGGLWGLFFCHELAKRPLLPNNREAKFLAAWGHH
jgi:hypothetical protein